MIYFSLELTKKHLNLDEDFCDDDEYIASLMEAAIDTVENYCDAHFCDIAEEHGGELPRSLVHAVLLLVGHLYQTREPVSYGNAVKIPHTLEYLYQPYVRYC